MIRTSEIENSRLTSDRIYPVCGNSDRILPVVGLARPHHPLTVATVVEIPDIPTFAEIYAHGSNLTRSPRKINIKKGATIMIAPSLISLQLAP
jgi:hypothetical protein